MKLRRTFSRYQLEPFFFFLQKQGAEASVEVTTDMLRKVSRCLLINFLLFRNFLLEVVDDLGLAKFIIL